MSAPRPEPVEWPPRPLPSMGRGVVWRDITDAIDHDNPDHTPEPAEEDR